jgi:hypothetical protein
VFGIAVPTRAFAACFVAAGYIMTKFSLFESRQDAFIHFEKLCTLEKGTPLIYVRDNRKLRAIFDGIDVFKGERRLRVKTIRKAVDLVPPEKSLSINIAKSKLKSVPTKQRGKEIDAKGGLLGKILSREELRRYMTSSKLECVIIGQLKLLRQEIAKTSFYLHHSENISEGTLQDILRVRRFLGTAEASRSVILPLSGRKAKKKLEVETPGLVIFDSPAAFIRWREKWPNSHWAVLLDRTDSEFYDAVDIVNQRYINRINECQFSRLETSPVGIEIVAFEERFSL